jgi:hypothetical protein
MDCKTICLQFIKLIISFYLLCVAILWWCFDYIKHFRVNSSTSESTDWGILFQAERITYKVSVYISCGTSLLALHCPWELTILRQLRGVLENKLNYIYNLTTIWLRDLIVTDNFSIGPLKSQKYWWLLSIWWRKVVTSIHLLSNWLTPTMMRDLVLLVRKWSHSCFFVVLDMCTSTSIWYGGKKIFFRFKEAIDNCLCIHYNRR